MIYNLANISEQKLFMEKAKWMVERCKKVELKEKRAIRTISQNRYLHLILNFFAVESGNTMEYVKREYFKKHCNPEIFVEVKDDVFLGRVQVVKSSSAIDTKQMTIAIDRFRNWSSVEAGIYLPDANEHEFMEHIQNEVERHREWL